MSTEAAGKLIPIEERPLYRLLMRGLPTYLKSRADGVTRLNMTEIATEIGYAPQAIYKRFLPNETRNTVSVGMARKLVQLSEDQADHPCAPADFEPLTMRDFEPFLI